MTAAGSGGIAALVLCGGRATRMGGIDKCLARLGQTTLLGSALARLRPQVKHMAISANGDPTRFDVFGLPVLADPVPDFQGPLAGILAGLQWASGLDQVDALLTTAGDTPFVPLDLAAQLFGARSHGPDVIAVASSGERRHPIVALWPIALVDDLRHFLDTSDRRSVAAFQAGHRTIDVPFDPVTLGMHTVDPFLNINTHSDHAEAERLLTGATR